MPPIEDEDKAIDVLDVPEAGIKVDLNDDDGEGGEREERAEQAARPEQDRDAKTGQWGKKKAERGKNKREESNWRQERDGLLAQINQLKGGYDGQIASLRAELESVRRQPTQREQQQSQDPFASKFSELDAALATELALIEKDEKRDYKRYNELRRQEQELIAERALWRSEQRRAQQQTQQGGQQQGGPSAAYQARFQIIQAEHPWMGDRRFDGLIDKVRNLRQYLINVEGLPDTLDTDRQAVQQAIARFGAQFGLRAPAAPSTRTRQMYEGPDPRRGARQADDESEVEIPREFLNGTGLSMNALRSAMRGDRR